jgi:ankyrin repeat protein
MKHLLLTTIAAVLLVGCGPKPPDISIHDAVAKGNIEAVKAHLAAGVDVNAKELRHRTPLHSAAYYGRKEVGELLIANGADVNAMGDYSITPLDRAFAFEHSEIADLLRKHGGKTGEELKAEEK